MQLKHMKNTIPKGIADLMGAAQIARAAAEEHAAAIPLAPTTVENLGIDADALTTARNSHEAGKVVLAGAFGSLASVTQTARAFLTLGRDTLKVHYGMRYSTAWNILGFTKTLEIPTSTPPFLVLLQAYETFYTANPGKEIVALNLTAARAQALYDQLSEARLNADTAAGQAQTLRIARDAAAVNLRKQLRLLITELNRKIGSLDPRWVAFGFNKPGASETPEVPENVTATLIDNNTAAIRWPRAPRAEHYRVWKKVKGVDQELIAVGSPTDLDFMLEGLPPNSTIEIGLSAVNSGGECRVSELITIVTPQESAADILSAERT